MADEPRESAHDDAAAGEPAPDARVQDLEAEASRVYARAVRARYEMRGLWEQAAGPDDFGIIEH